MAFRFKPIILATKVRNVFTEIYTFGGEFEIETL